VIRAEQLIARYDAWLWEQRVKDALRANFYGYLVSRTYPSMSRYRPGIKRVYFGTDRYFSAIYCMPDLAEQAQPEIALEMFHLGMRNILLNSRDILHNNNATFDIEAGLDLLDRAFAEAKQE